MPGGPEPFDRIDESDDADFYSSPRLVNHIEAGAIETLRVAYGELLPDSGHILDLMSAWRSHLPRAASAEAEHRFTRVTGLGMNEIELSENPQLDEWVVHDLNSNPVLPFESAAFDAAVCTVSIQYLVHPIEVLRDLRRVLRPGGVAALAFSNRCFPTKAVSIWNADGDAHHCELTETYLTMAGYEGVRVLRLDSPDDPVFVATGQASD